MSPNEGLGRLVCFLLPLFIYFNSTTTHASSPPDERLIEILSELSGSKTGEMLIERGLRAWELKNKEEIASKIKWAQVSKTQSVVHRTFDSMSLREIKERKVHIFLNWNLSRQEAVLDLAHELVHATSPPTWDPYDETLSAAKYIFETIEGAGGELDAIAVECRVSQELQWVELTLRRCRRYLRGTSKRLDRRRLRQDLYQIGQDYGSLSRKLKSGILLLPLLSDRDPELYSSTGKSTYPVSLFQEFVLMNQMACENSMRRYRNLDVKDDRVARETLKFIESRCH